MSNKLERIKTAYDEAKRFMGRCDDLFDRLEDDEQLVKDIEGGFGSKETAAVRRASMDLTRALAEMRKP